MSASTYSGQSWVNDNSGTILLGLDRESLTCVLFGNEGGNVGLEGSANWKQYTCWSALRLSQSNITSLATHPVPKPNTMIAMMRRASDAAELLMIPGTALRMRKMWPYDCVEVRLVMKPDVGLLVHTSPEVGRTDASLTTMATATATEMVLKRPQY